MVFAEPADTSDEGSEIVVTSPISAADRRKIVRKIDEIIHDNNVTEGRFEGDSPNRYFHRLMDLDDYIFEKVRDMHVIPEICERLHPHNQLVAEYFRKAGWAGKGLEYHPKNFDTNFIKDYYTFCGSTSSGSD